MSTRKAAAGLSLEVSHLRLDPLCLQMVEIVTGFDLISDYHMEVV